MLTFLSQNSNILLWGSSPNLLILKTMLHTIPTTCPEGSLNAIILMQE
jgi:hypothetical protein